NISKRLKITDLLNMSTPWSLKTACTWELCGRGGLAKLYPGSAGVRPRPHYGSHASRVRQKPLKGDSVGWLDQWECVAKKLDGGLLSRLEIDAHDIEAKSRRGLHFEEKF